MEVYRIGRERYIRDLSGEGAKLYGGRWNRKGIPVLYTSQNISLAALELLVHASYHQMPADLMLLTLRMPDSAKIHTITVNDLPENWREFPAPAQLSDIGSEWAESTETLSCRVPSAVVPHEWNVLLNPKHGKMEEVEIANVQPFLFDVRLVST